VSPAADPYQRFLTSADVATWAGCLDETRQAVEAAGHVEEEATQTARGLCLAIYLEWLAQTSGDLATAKRAAGCFEDLRKRVVGAESAPSWSPCRALLLIRGGYYAHAARLLGSAGSESPAIAALLVRRNDLSALVALRRLVRGNPPTGFLPAVHLYTSALVNVGAVHEAQNLLSEGDWDADEPLLLDLRGCIHERLGQWSAALDAYRRSPWPVHRYRSTVVGTITGQSTTVAELEVDEAMREVLFQLEGDLDQGEVARCAAFLNACLWQPVVTWILELELGKLSFRRRQYAEADAHLRRALAEAPTEAKAAISYFRFTNLTWLSGRSPNVVLDLSAEAITAGHEAIQFGGDNDMTAGVRTWLVPKTGDHSLIPASIETWRPYDQAEAFAALADDARAIDCWLDSLAVDFNHRAANDLMVHFDSAGLTGAVARLAEVVLDEASDSFLALWETCRTLQTLRSTDGSTDDSSDDDAIAFDDRGPATGVQDLIRRCQERLIELSRFEFMNTVRTHELVRMAGQEDLAEELLQRAAKQADGVSELVAVATLQAQSSRGLYHDQEALRCLYRARATARDRLERLQIARELIRYGVLRDGRAILLQERIFSPETPLSPSELVAALQCSAACTQTERADLVLRGARRLRQDAESGLLGPDPRQYATRLLELAGPTGGKARELLGEDLMAEPASEWSGPAEREWDRVRDKLDDVIAETEVSEEPVATRVAEVLGPTSFGVRLLAAAHLRSRLAALHEMVRTTTPSVPTQRIPVARCYDDESPRVIHLCDRWRSRILGEDADGAQLREFFERERELFDEWEGHRRNDAAPTLHRIRRTAAALCQALEVLPDLEPRHRAHPVLSTVIDAIEVDTEALRAAVSDQAVAAGLLADTSAAERAESTG
jgi:tetratricopeptide (TPR) repeat protein